MAATVTPASFRANYPEFVSNTAYPDTLITYWLTISALLLNQTRWMNLLDFGTELFVAHNLALERQAVKSAASGAVPGIQTGAINNKSVGPVSQGYDTSAGLELEAGHWNLTTYGTRFIRMARMVGSGGIQL